MFQFMSLNSKNLIIDLGLNTSNAKFTFEISVARTHFTLKTTKTIASSTDDFIFKAQLNTLSGNSVVVIFLSYINPLQLFYKSFQCSKAFILHFLIFFIYESKSRFGYMDIAPKHIFFFYKLCYHHDSEVSNVSHGNASLKTVVSSIKHKHDLRLKLITGNCWIKTKFKFVNSINYKTCFNAAFLPVKIMRKLDAASRSRNLWRFKLFLFFLFLRTYLWNSCLMNCYAFDISIVNLNLANFLPTS